MAGKQFAADADLKTCHLLDRTLTQNSYNLGYKPWCHSRTNVEMSLVPMSESDVYHLLPMLYVYIAARIKLSLCLFV
jgi:hypothetical protein